MRNLIRWSSGTPASRSIIARCTSAAQRAASTTLGNSASIPSPVVLTMPFWRAFETLWLPASLLSGDQQQRLTDALYAASRHWSFEIQFDKGLAGAPDDALAASRDTATNPAVLAAFGLALIGSFGSPAYPGIPGYAPNLTEARGEATMIANAMGDLRKVRPEPAAYVPESNFFEKDWQRSYWGTTMSGYARSNDSTIRTAYSLSITVSAARTGATTVLKGVPRISRRRPWSQPFGRDLTTGRTAYGASSPPRCSQAKVP
jgi:hypothetical protein